MSNTNTTVSLPLPGILTIIFVILKLTEVIAWSWWWVLSPLWITFLFILLVVLVAVGTAGKK